MPWKFQTKRQKTGVCATIDWSVQSYSAYFYLCFPSLSLSAQLRSNQQLVSLLLPFLSFEEAHAIFCKRNSHLVSYHYLFSCQLTAMKPLHTQKTSPIPYTFLDSFAFSYPAFLSLIFISHLQRSSIPFCCMRIKLKEESSSIGWDASGTKSLNNPVRMLQMPRWCPYYGVLI